MTWFLLAIASACFLGGYDVLKKHALRDNAVMPVLLFNTLICCALFLPLLSLSHLGFIDSASHWFVPQGDWEWHAWTMLKATIVLSSWICGYFAMKHLPLTIVGPINATRPVMTLTGALLLFQEQFNLWQWAGVGLAILAFFLLSRSGKKEGIDFRHNRWIFLLLMAAILGACSGLYDKYLLAPVVAGGRGMNAIFVQTWFNVYQVLLMGTLFFLLWWPHRRNSTPFVWRWSIARISVFLSIADLLYFYALSQPDALIAVVSMTRRSSVLVSFLFAALVLREKNLRSKAIDLLLVFLSLVCLGIGAIY